VLLFSALQCGHRLTILPSIICRRKTLNSSTMKTPITRQTWRTRMVSCIMHNYTFVMPSLVINGRRQCVCGLSVRACVRVCKVKVNRSALYISPLSLKRSDMAHGPYPKGITQFYLPPTHEPYLYLLPSRKATPPFRAFPRRDGQAELTWVADYVCEHVSQHNVLQTACANFTKFRCI